MRTIEIPDPGVVVLIGPAGSGKSTLAARLFEPDEILSSDAFRKLVSGDEADQRASGLAFRRLHDELAVRLRARRLSVVDATNLTPHARRVLLARAQDAGVPVVAIVLDLPPALVHARNAGRTRVVDPAVVDRHLEAVRRLVDSGALKHEGFAEVIVLSDASAAEALRIERVRSSPTR